MSGPGGALVIGEALIDIVPGTDGPREYAGGSPMNVAIGLGRLGRRPALATWIGPDQRGRVIRDHCAACEVALLPGSDGAVRTSSANVSLDASGSAQYVFDLAFEFPPVPAALAPRIVHAGSIGATIQPGADAVAAYLRANPSGATVTYDPNMRPAIMGTADAVRPRIESLVAASDLVKVSDEDLAYLYGTGPEGAEGQGGVGRTADLRVGADRDRDSVSGQPEGAEGKAVAQAFDVARDWLALGPAVVIVTLGQRGSMAVTRGGVTVEVAPRPAAVADTVGAGDSFMAGIIDGLWSLDLLGPGRRDSLEKLDAAQLRTVLEWATRIASITVSRPGANPPWRHELTGSDI